MAGVSTLPSIGFTLTLPDTTTLVRSDDMAFGAFAEEVPTNCSSIILFNMDAANRVFVKYGRTVEVNAGNMTVANSTVLPILSSMTFAVGYVGDREDISSSGPVCLFLMAETGAAVQVNVTFLMGRGSNLL